MDITKLCLSFGLTLISLQCFATEIKIELGETRFVIPQFAKEFRKREATIAPHEIEMAETFKEMLSRDDKQAVLTELDQYFDLELSVALLHLKAQVYFSLEEYQRAETLLKTVLLRMPELVRAHSDIGTLYLIQDNFKQAQAHFAKAISLGERSPQIYGQLGYLNLRLHSAHSAVSAYQNALMIEPDNFQWQQGLLAALTQANQFDSAIALANEMLKSHSNNQELWLNRAFLYLHFEDDFNALTSLEAAIALGNQDESNFTAAAQLHLKLNSHERAIELLDTYMQSANFDADVLNQVIAWLAQKQQWQTAADLVGKFSPRTERLSARERSVFYMQNGLVYAGTGKTALADEQFKLALNTDPANEQVLMAAAQFYHDQGVYPEAEVLYTRAEAFETTEKAAKLGKAQVYIDLRDYESALNLLRTAYRQFPELVELKENITILEATIQAQKL